MESTIIKNKTFIMNPLYFLLQELNKERPKNVLTVEYLAAIIEDLLEKDEQYQASIDSISVGGDL